MLKIKSDMNKEMMMVASKTLLKIKSDMSRDMMTVASRILFVKNKKK